LLFVPMGSNRVGPESPPVVARTWTPTPQRLQTERLVASKRACQGPARPWHAGTHGKRLSARLRSLSHPGPGLVQQPGGPGEPWCVCVARAMQSIKPLDGRDLRPAFVAAAPAAASLV